MAALREKTCIMCKEKRTELQYIKTSNRFFVGGYSPICTECLERLIDKNDLESVDELCCWLNIPFLINQWINATNIDPSHPLLQYIKMVNEALKYEKLSWKDMNENWRKMREEGTLEESLDICNETWLREMKQKWVGVLTIDDYRYLDNFYKRILETFPIVTATQEDEAKRLCRVALNANKKIENGEDAKDDMSVYHNIMKANGFEPKNARNVSDFDSIGECFVYYSKKGWEPNFYNEDKDGIDFAMHNDQQYLRRLVEGETNLQEQVENQRKKYNIAARLEEDLDNDYQFKEYEEDSNEEIEYEGEEEMIYALTDKTTEETTDNGKQ